MFLTPKAPAFVPLYNTQLSSYTYTLLYSFLIHRASPTLPILQAKTETAAEVHIVEQTASDCSARTELPMTY